MNKHIYIIAGLCAALMALTACSDDFLEVKNPTGEPLEEYYSNEETLNEALTAAPGSMVMVHNQKFESHSTVFG